MWITCYKIIYEPKIRLKFVAFIRFLEFLLVDYKSIS
jgi:hypothetical protein